MIPEAFLERMRALLGEEEYPAFLKALVEEESVHAIRYNKEKIDREEVLSFLAPHLSPIPYASDGFFCNLVGIGHHPLHHAGAVYSQDPGAMAPLFGVPVARSWRVADFCASPGGKSAQLSAFVGADGFLLSNEINLSRCRVLTGNVERLGLKNTCVTNVSSDVIASWFPSFFDLVVVDAPCSGEGMFRKYSHAGEEWSPALVSMCAKRQSDILSDAVKTLKDGGYLLYSTCTFSVEENEENVDALLCEHPELSVVDVLPEVKRITADGVAYSAAKHPESLKKARRFYPHLYSGEGQFMCLLQKTGGSYEQKPQYKSVAEPLSKAEKALLDDFLRDVLSVDIKEILPNFIPVKLRDKLCLVPMDIPFPPHSVYLFGVTVGTFQKGRIEPHHHFFSSLGKYFKRKILYSPEEQALLSYLHGDTVATDLPGGYAVVTVAGAPLGGVKVVNGVAKNHYPKGLRIP